MPEYLRKANDELIVLPIIETAQGVTAIDEILSVPGIDAVAVGTVDLSADMGHVGDVSAPEVTQAVTTVIARCRLNRKPILMAAATRPQFEASIRMGATLVMAPFSQWLISLGREFLTQLRSRDE